MYGFYGDVEFVGSVLACRLIHGIEIANYSAKAEFRLDLRIERVQVGFRCYVAITTTLLQVVGRVPHGRFVLFMQRG
jgi:hypothetical protein